MIKWSITNMESYKDTGIVLSANWICTHSQDDIIVTRSGKSLFNLDNPNSVETLDDSNSLDIPMVSEEIVIDKEFIPYDLLTEEIVLNWVWVDGGVNKTLVEESVNQELNSKLNPNIIQKQPHWIK